MCRFLCALSKLCFLIINYKNDKNISRKKRFMTFDLCKRISITFSRFKSYSPRNCAKSPTNDHQKNGQRLQAAARRRQNRKMVGIFKNDFGCTIFSAEVCQKMAKKEERLKRKKKPRATFDLYRLFIIARNMAGPFGG
jgi:hypothetical protein